MNRVSRLPRNHQAVDLRLRGTDHEDGGIAIANRLPINAITNVIENSCSNRSSGSGRFKVQALNYGFKRPALFAVTTLLGYLRKSFTRSEKGTC